jgi:hypothetical protein
MRRTLLALALTVASLDAFAGTGKVVIVNIDLPNVGFNEATPATPVGGNPGTTLGQQRMNVFNEAAARWTTMLDTNVDIVVQASFAPLQCDDTGAVLASAGPRTFVKNFAAAPKTEVYYPIALANKMAGTDLAPTLPDIVSQFNADVDNAECLGEQNWYYGLDGNHGIHSDLLVVVLHELSHGLGFSGATRAPNFRDNTPSVFDTMTLDRSANRTWDQLSQVERNLSLTNTGNVVWNGPNVKAVVNRYLQATTTFTVTEPTLVARNYDIGIATFGPMPSRTAMSGRVVRALDAADAAGPTTFDGCSAFTNAAALNGNVAMIDRGTCTFVSKVRNAQSVGAVGVIIVDNSRETCTPPSMGGDAVDVTIPVISIAPNDGDLLKAQLGNGTTVQGLLRNDPSQLAGTSPEGYMRLYAPCTDDPGSSIHHWDVTSFPNLLMEPAVNGDLLHNVDLTQFILQDMGWAIPVKSGRRALIRK